jgi:hypothetical protein
MVRLHPGFYVHTNGIGDFARANLKIENQTAYIVQGQCLHFAIYP